MKLNAWLLIALVPLAALPGMAQTTNTAPPPPTPPPPIVTSVPETPAETPAAKPEKPAKPAKKVKHKKTAKAAKTTKAAKESPAKTGKTNEVMVLNPPVAAAVKCNVLDVRGQPGFVGEIITYLKKGESVVVLEEIKLAHVRAGEPEHWSKIVMPANTAVWVSGGFIDPNTKEVRVKKVNVRGGPGENYSVIARLDKGAVVTEIGKKEGWLEIATPTNAFAYIASEFLEVQPQNDVTATSPPPAPAPAPAPAPPVVVNVPTETPPVAGKPPETPSAGIAAPAPTAEAPAPAPAPAPVVTAPPPTATQPEPGKMEVPRIVTRDGYVHRSYNIQSPTAFELHDVKTGVLTEYVQPEPKDKFKKFIGTRVRITGSESLDERWPRTPILQVQTVDRIP